VIDINSHFMYNYSMAKKTKRTKRRNLVAKDLRTPKYRMRVVKSKKLYTRKNKKENTLNAA
jgi:hypothetical protein